MTLFTALALVTAAMAVLLAPRLDEAAPVLGHATSPDAAGARSLPSAGHDADARAVVRHSRLEFDQNVAGARVFGDGAAISNGWLAGPRRSHSGPPAQRPETAGATGLGACCTIDGCVPVAGADECNALGGFYFPNESCDSGWCEPGACCSQNNCINADAYSCISGGRDYLGPDVECAADPCGIGVGGCCLGEECQVLSPEACAAAGGIYLGPGTICDNDPCVQGACCFEDGCFDGAQYECLAEGGTFVAGATCADLPCTESSLCPSGTLFGQSPDGPDDFIAGTSEASSGLARYENFFAVGGAITGVHWWGVDLDYIGGSQFAECTELDPTFEIG
ncbi:MAG: hypothetical protein KDA22_12550, partial [Phycisphaerales bacterium]|nr:hypothetical protein [Phycisphaerales bacterium]